MSPSVASLASCAHTHLEHYTSGRTRAFLAYDGDFGDPDQLTPLDLLAPALLSMRTDYNTVVPLVAPVEGEPTAHQLLHEAMSRVLTDPSTRGARFIGVDLDEGDAAWSVVRAAMVATQPIKGITAVYVSKVLHRKRPDLVPIYDSELYRFYFGKSPAGVGAPSRYWRALQADLCASNGFLTDLAADRTTPDGRALSLLRVLDIVVWEHAVTKCTGESAQP